MAYVVDGILPGLLAAEEQQRVLDAAKRLSWRDERLYLVDDKYDRRIPPIRDRVELLESTAVMMAVPNGDRMYHVLRYQYYWRNMHRDCVNYVNQMLGRQLEAARYRSPPYLFPTQKGNAPFTTWAIDCITGLTPAAPNGGTTLVLAINAYSKWIEWRILPTLDSNEIARFVYEQIVTRFGCPHSIRCDQGVEFKGAFIDLCNHLGVQRRAISTLWPRANGIIERYNREVKGGIRRLIGQNSQLRWNDVIPDVIWALRILPASTTGYSAFELVYKQQPNLPLPVELKAAELVECRFDHDPALQRWAEDLEKLLEFWQVVEDYVANRLKLVGHKMRVSYLKRSSLADVDFRDAFREGDKVIHRQKRTGKLLVKSMGPYTFVRYANTARTNAWIADVNGKRSKVSSGNLLPFRAPMQPSKRIKIMEGPSELVTLPWAEEWEFDPDDCSVSFSEDSE